MKSQNPGALLRTGVSRDMAVAAGFEPAVGGYPTLAFEASTFGRSDTPPRKILGHIGALTQITCRNRP